MPTLKRSACAGFGALVLVMLSLAPAIAAEPSAKTVADAEAFLADAEKTIQALLEESNRASWVKANFITEDTQYLEAVAAERTINASVELAKQAFAYDSVDLPPDMRRKMERLKLALTMPTPADPEKSRELTTIATRMDGAYGAGQYCRPNGECLDIGEISKIMAESRDPALLKEVWEGWHTVGAPMKKDYARFVELSNEGARSLGFKDTGAMWRAKYDMPADDFAKEVDRLWGQVKPLYDSLHCYTRWKLAEKYGNDVVPAKGPIPAHLLGNLWQQDWANIYDLLAPADADPGYDLTALLKAKDVDELEMVRYDRERFFTSVGFEPLPETFWTARSSSSLATATSSVTRAPGTSTSPTTASRCASSGTPRTSTRSTTSSDTTSTSGLTT
jgi:peptidyl-dipeptidase A